MRVPSREVRYGAWGVLSGVAALVAGRCAGGACTSCLACAVPGAAVLLAALGARPARRAGRLAPPAPGAPRPPAVSLARRREGPAPGLDDRSRFGNTEASGLGGSSLRRRS